MECPSGRTVDGTRGRKLSDTRIVTELGAALFCGASEVPNCHRGEFMSVAESGRDGV